MKKSFVVSALSPVRWLGTADWVAGILFAVALTGFLVSRSMDQQSPLAPLSYFGGLILPLIVSAIAIGWPTSVTVGEDGVSYRRYGFTRFVPFSEIAKAAIIQKMGPRGRRPNESRAHSAVRLTLTSGANLDLPIGTTDLPKGEQTVEPGTLGQFGEAHPDAKKVCEAIEERVKATSAVHAPTDLAKSLARGRQTVEEWRSKLAAHGGAREQYRDGSTEALWRVVEDTEAPRDARAAAAMALRSDLQAEGRARLRVVADECESPKLRIALETALDEEAEDDRVYEALEKVSRQGE
jgi:hypothetical protein